MLNRHAYKPMYTNTNTMYSLKSMLKKQVEFFSSISTRLIQRLLFLLFVSKCILLLKSNVGKPKLVDVMLYHVLTYTQNSIWI